MNFSALFLLMLLLAQQQPFTIRGVATHLEKMATPRDSVLRVTVFQSQGTTPFREVANREVRTEGKQVPIPFSLELPAPMSGQARYRIRAELLYRDKVLFAGERSFRGAAPRPLSITMKRLR